jgi:hypothetical protein
MMPLVRRAGWAHCAKATSRFIALSLPVQRLQRRRNGGRR